MLAFVSCGDCYNIHIWLTVDFSSVVWQTTHTHAHNHLTSGLIITEGNAYTPAGNNRGI